MNDLTDDEIIAAWIGGVIGFVWGLLCAILGYVTLS